MATQDQNIKKLREMEQKKEREEEVIKLGELTRSIIMRADELFERMKNGEISALLELRLIAKLLGWVDGTLAALNNQGTRKECFATIAVQSGNLPTIPPPGPPPSVDDDSGTIIIEAEAPVRHNRDDQTQVMTYKTGQKFPASAEVARRARHLQ